MAASEGLSLEGLTRIRWHAGRPGRIVRRNLVHIRKPRYGGTDITWKSFEAIDGSDGRPASFGLFRAYSGTLVWVKPHMALMKPDYVNVKTAPVLGVVVPGLVRHYLTLCGCS